MNSVENVEKKNNSSAEKTNGKQSLETQIKELREQLDISREELEKCHADLEWSRNIFNKNVQEKEFCVGHLKKVLLSEKEKSSIVYKNLLAKRARSKIAKQSRKETSVVEKDDLITKSSSTQKLEYKDKSSFTKEKWFEQTNNQTYLNKAKSSETSTMKTPLQTYRITQEGEVVHLEELLKYQKFFSRNCEDLKQSWTMAIQSMVPELTERKKRLKNVCQYYAGGLLKAQDQNRILNTWQKCFGLENEMLPLTHKKVKVRQFYLKKHLEMLENQRKVLSLHESRKKDSVLGNRFPSYISSPSNQHFVYNDITPARTAAALNTWTEIEHGAVNNWMFELFMDNIECDQSSLFKLKDSCDGVKNILKHQAEYNESIKIKFDEQTTKNGCLMSFICTVGKVLQSRCRKINSDEDLDLEVFNQIKMLLDPLKLQ